MPILRAGVADGDAVMFVSTADTVEAARASLGPAEASAVEFQDSAQQYRTPAAALTGFQRLFAAHAERGRRLRVVSEQPVASARNPELGELSRIDAATNVVSLARNATVVCAYDLRATPPHTLAMARRSHPEVIEQGNCRPSPVFTDPARLMGELHAQPPLPEPAGTPLELADPQDAAEARRYVAGAAAVCGLGEPALDKFVTAVNEIVTNAMVHAVPDRVRVWAEHDEVVCEVRDRGFGIADPFVGYRLPRPGATGGRGMWLARQLVDLVEVRTGPCGSVVRLRIRLGGEPGPQ